jgi:hypothetical protein
MRLSHAAASASTDELQSLNRDGEEDAGFTKDAFGVQFSTANVFYRAINAGAPTS